MKILPRIGEKCPIDSECVHSVTFNFFSHEFLLIPINTLGNLQRTNEIYITKHEL